MTRPFLMLIAACMAMCIVKAQESPVDDLMDFASLSQKKFESFLSRQHYIPAGSYLQNDTIVDVWQQALKPDSTRPSVTRQISRYRYEGQTYFEFRTSLKDEMRNSLQQLRKAGFSCPANQLDPDSVLLFQKREVSLQCSQVEEEGLTLYTLFLKKWRGPYTRSIRFADDLLQFDSHEHLATYFGEANTRSDIYYFSEKEVNACTVLFPNTPRQAVFIWEDQVNKTRLSHVLIGGGIRTAGTSGFNRSISENAWTLRDGVRYNMRLEDILSLNNGDINFFGRSSDYYLMIRPVSSGELDMSTRRIILDCINCAGDPLLDEKLVSGTDAIDRGLRLHVGLMVLLPSPDSSEAARRFAQR